MEVEAHPRRERLLDPVDRISEILFGLVMAVTIVGSLSIANAGRDDVRTTLVAALGCNIAWGMVDALMYLVRTLTERTRHRMLAKRIVQSDAATAYRLIRQALPDHVIAVTGDEELEGIRRRLVAARESAGAGLGREDYLAALGIFLLVVLATFPVVLPFLLIQDAGAAMRVSRIVSIAMLFAAGFALGRHAGHPHPLRIGIAMALLGAAVVVAVMALGG